MRFYVMVKLTNVMESWNRAIVQLYKVQQEATGLDVETEELKLIAGNSTVLIGGLLIFQIGSGKVFKALEVSMSKLFSLVHN